MKAVEIYALLGCTMKRSYGLLKTSKQQTTKNSFQAPRRISYLLPKGNTIYFLHYGEKDLFI